MLTIYVSLSALTTTLQINLVHSVGNVCHNVLLVSLLLNALLVLLTITCGNLSVSMLVLMPTTPMSNRRRVCHVLPTARHAMGHPNINALLAISVTTWIILNVLLLAQFIGMRMSMPNVIGAMSLACTVLGLLNSSAYNVSTIISCTVVSASMCAPLPLTWQSWLPRNVRIALGDVRRANQLLNAQYASLGSI